jgi:hypothetical protein
MMSMWEVFTNIQKKATRKEEAFINATTANLDFVRGGNNEYIDHLSETADAMLIQEAKDFSLRSTVNRRLWTVVQNTNDDAHQGVAVAVRKSAIRVLGSRYVLGTEPHGRKMLTRYILLVACQHKGSGQTFTLASAHLPPQRYVELQPPMISRIARVAYYHPRLILGVDANMPISKLAAQTKTHATGIGIIGILSKLPMTGGHASSFGIHNNLTDHPSWTTRVNLLAHRDLTVT